MNIIIFTVYYTFSFDLIFSSSQDAPLYTIYTMLAFPMQAKFSLLKKIIKQTFPYKKHKQKRT